MKPGLTNRNPNTYIFNNLSNVLEFDISVNGKAEGYNDSMASAKITEKTYSDGYNFKTDYHVIIYLHPKCNKCGKYLKEPEEQVYDSLEHEIMEAVVVDILDKDFGKYDTAGFDGVMRLWGKVMIPHDCRTFRGLFSNRQMIYVPSTGTFEKE